MNKIGFILAFLVLLIPIQSSFGLETVVIDFETKPDGTPITGGTLVQAEPNSLITDVNLDGEPHHLIYESIGVRFGSNDIIYGSPGVFNVPLSLFNLMVGNTGEPAEGIGQSSTDDIDIFFIHPITNQPRTVLSVQMEVIDPELPMTVKAFDINGIEVDSFSNPCLDCTFTASVSSPGGISHVVASISGDSTFGIDDLTIEQEPINFLIGGEIIPIQTTSLLVSGIQTNLSWIVTAAALVSGLSAFFIWRKNE